MKCGVVFLLFVLVIAVVPSVLAVQVSFDPIKNEVLPGESASYTIHVRNEDPRSVLVTIKSIDLAWTMDRDSERFVLDAGQTRDVVVVYTPINKKLKAGTYGLNFQASTSEEKQVQLLPVQVVDYTELLEVKLPSVPVDPRRPSIVTLELKNKFAIPLKDLKVVLKSELFEVQQQTDLGGRAQTSLEFPIRLSVTQREGEYALQMLITIGANTVVDQKTTVKVSKYGAVQEVVEPEQNVLSYGETIVRTNRGNTVAEDEYEREFGALSYRFSMFDPEPSNVIVADGSYKVVWRNTLQPGTSVTLKYKTNYGKPLLYAVILIVIVAGVYWARKQYIVVKKRVLVLHSERGGVAIMKVVLGVRNTSGRELVGVTVVDKVPRIINAPTDFGVYKPEHVKQVPDGIMIAWKIPHMKRGEEVMLSYKIASKMHLVGGVVLPRAVAKSMMGAKKFVGRSPSVTLRARK